MFHRTVALAALLLLSATAAPAAQAVDAVEAPPAHDAASLAAVGRAWPATISGHLVERNPEGVAWDPTRQAFLVGSIATGRISVIDRTGKARTLVQQAPGVSTFGLHVDAVRNRFLVTYADIGNGDRSTPATAYKQSGVAIYNLRTGRLLHRVELDTAKLNPQGGNHGANDLAIDGKGNAYVTDPASDAIYRITPAGVASVFVRDPRLGSPSIGMNGIVWDPAGYLLAVRYDTGTLLRISASARISEVRVERPLVGGDGLAFTPDRKLVVVTNTLGTPGANAVTVLRSTDEYRSARVVATKAWPIAGPTTVALTPYGAYVLSGRIDVLIGGGRSDEFDLHRF